MHGECAADIGGASGRAQAALGMRIALPSGYPVGDRTMQSLPQTGCEPFGLVETAPAISAVVQWHGDQALGDRLSRLRDGLGEQIPQHRCVV